MELHIVNWINNLDTLPVPDRFICSIDYHIKSNELTFYSIFDIESKSLRIINNR